MISRPLTWREKILLNLPAKKTYEIPTKVGAAAAWKTLQHNLDQEKQRYRRHNLAPLAAGHRVSAITAANAVRKSGIAASIRVLN